MRLASSTIAATSPHDAACHGKQPAREIAASSDAERGKLEANATTAAEPRVLPSHGAHYTRIRDSDATRKGTRTSESEHLREKPVPKVIVADGPSYGAPSISESFWLTASKHARQERSVAGFFAIEATTTTLPCNRVRKLLLTVEKRGAWKRSHATHA
jgi:hypothetical protein